MLIRAVPQIVKVNIMVVRSDNIASTRPIIGTILYEFPHIIYVLTGDSLGDSESESDLDRDS